MTHLVIDINTFFVHWLHCGLIRYKVAGSYGLGERDGRQLIRRRYGKRKHKGQRSKRIEKNWGQWLTVPVAYEKIHTPCHVMSLYPMCILRGVQRPKLWVFAWCSSGWRDALSAKKFKIANLREVITRSDYRIVFYWYILGKSRKNLNRLSVLIAR